MTDAMREAIVSVLYKGKGKDPMQLKSYRPISITPTEYRIMTVAIQISLAKVVEKLIGRMQVAYLADGRYMHDNTLFLAEALRRMDDSGDGRVAMLVDNSMAFDRVKWSFIHEIVEAYGFPCSFAGMATALYKGITFRIKVNGQVGAPCPTQKYHQLGTSVVRCKSAHLYSRARGVAPYDS
eukprot:1695128-Prymnesium_polylepis.1